MDDATAATVLELQLQDIDELLKRCNAGRGPSDAQLALQLYRRDLHERYALLSDRRIALSIGTAVRTDSGVLAATRWEEVQCASDRQFALRLSGQVQSVAGPPLSPPQRVEGLPSQDLDAVNLARSIPPSFVFPVPQDATQDAVALAAAFLSELDRSTLNPLEEHTDAQDDVLYLGSSKRKRAPSPTTDSHANPGSEKPAAKRVQISPHEHKPNSTSDSSNHFPTPIIRPSPIHEVCTGCTDRYPRKDMMEAPCKHYYCHDCTSNLVTVSLELGSNFPPSCCTVPVTLDAIYGHVSFDLVWDYQQKRDEMEKAYTLQCATSGCDTLIASEEIKGKKGRCKTCNQDTCRDCKNQWHEGTSCKEREENQKLATLADAQGWRSCYNCGTFIDMIFGCNHMVLSSASFVDPSGRRANVLNLTMISFRPEQNESWAVERTSDKVMTPDLAKCNLMRSDARYVEIVATLTGNATMTRHRKIRLNVNFAGSRRVDSSSVASIAILQHAVYALGDIEIHEDTIALTRLDPGAGS